MITCLEYGSALSARESDRSKAKISALMLTVRKKQIKFLNDPVPLPCDVFCNAKCAGVFWGHERGETNLANSAPLDRSR